VVQLYTNWYTSYVVVLKLHSFLFIVLLIIVAMAALLLCYVLPGNVTHDAYGSILAWVGVTLIDLLLTIGPREASGGAVAAVAVGAEVSTGAVVAGGLVTAGVHINIAQGSIVALLTCAVIGMSTVAVYYVCVDRSWEGESNRTEVK